MIGDIAARNPGNGAIVVNIDRRKHGSGTHWCLLYTFDNGRQRYWFDPISSDMGGFPPNAITELPGDLWFNGVGYQPPMSNLCGYYTIALGRVLERVKPQTIADVVSCVRSLFGDVADETDIRKII